MYEGKGSHTIARELEEAAVPTSPYMKRWTGSSILRILRNEKYCGDLVQKKTITPDYLTHEKKCNLGQEDLIVMRDHHQAIISRQLFEAAQQKLNQTSPPLNQKRQYSNRYCFSGKIVCGHCGSHYVSRTKNRKDHTTYRIWRCHRRTVYGSTAEHSSQAALCCDNPSLNDHALRLALQHVFQHLVFNRPQLVSQLSQAVQSAISLDAPVPTTVHKAHCHTISAIQKKRQILLEMYHHQEITASELEQALVRYDGQIQAFSKNMPSLSQPSVFAQITSHITDLIENFTWDETFYRCLLDHITVKPNGLVEIHFLHLPCAFSFQLTRSP